MRSRATASIVERIRGSVGRQEAVHRHEQGGRVELVGVERLRVAPGASRSSRDPGSPGESRRARPPTRRPSRRHPAWGRAPRLGRGRPSTAPSTTGGAAGRRASPTCRRRVSRHRRAATSARSATKLLHLGMEVAHLALAQVQAVQELAVDVELLLRPGAVADPHGGGVAPAAQVRQRRARSGRARRRSRTRAPAGPPTAGRGSGGPRTSSRRRPSRSPSPATGSRCGAPSRRGVRRCTRRSRSAAAPRGRRRRGTSSARPVAMRILFVVVQVVRQDRDHLGERHRLPLAGSCTISHWCWRSRGQCSPRPSISTIASSPWSVGEAVQHAQSRPAARSPGRSCRARGACSSCVSFRQGGCPGCASRMR